MNTKKKLSMSLVLCVVMGESAHQGMSVTQALVAMPQESQTVTTQTQNQVDQTKKSKWQTRKQPSKQRKVSSRGKHTLKRVGIAVSVIVGVVLGTQIVGGLIWYFASALI